MIADTKRVQTVINLLYTRVTKPIQDAYAVAATIRQAIIDNQLTEQFSAEELTALQTFVTDLDALASSSVVTAITDRYVPTHRNRAITIEGVND